MDFICWFVGDVAVISVISVVFNSCLADSGGSY
jgi:hypothetical protein